MTRSFSIKLLLMLSIVVVTLAGSIVLNSCESGSDMDIDSLSDYHDAYGGES